MSMSYTKSRLVLPRLLLNYNKLVCRVSFERINKKKYRCRLDNSDRILSFNFKTEYCRFRIATTLSIDCYSIHRFENAERRRRRRDPIGRNNVFGFFKPHGAESHAPSAPLAPSHPVRHPPLPVRSRDPSKSDADHGRAPRWFRSGSRVRTVANPFTA